MGAIQGGEWALVGGKKRVGGIKVRCIRVLYTREVVGCEGQEVRFAETKERVKISNLPIIEA